MFRKIFWLFLPLAIGCNQSTEVDLSQIKQESEFKRFDQAFFESDTAKMPTEIDRLAKDFPEFFSGGKTLRFWKSQRTDPNQQELYKATQDVFFDFKEVNENLNFSMKHLYHYFPNTPPITFYSYISNLDMEYPVLFAPQAQVCFAGMDNYLGPDKKYYQGVDSYLAFYRQPTFMVRDCIEAISEIHINRKREAANLLDDMLYYGRALYILQKVMPQKEPAVIIKYPPEKIGFCQKNERTMWAYFVENDLLFDTNQDLKRRFIELAPFSKFRTKLDAETPGMVGRWVGWQVIKSFMENNPDVTVAQLANETDSQKMLKLSGYKP